MSSGPDVGVHDGGGHGGSFGDSSFPSGRGPGVSRLSIEVDPSKNGVAAASQAKDSPHINGDHSTARSSGSVFDQLLAPAQTKEIAPVTMTFAQYLSEVKAHPHRLLRNAAGYVRDALTFDVDESINVRRQGVTVPVYPFLTDPHQSLAARDPAFGMDRVAHHFREVLDEQASLPYARRWGLLFGPFASGKSTFIATALRRLEYFSQHHPDGVLYRPMFEFSNGSGEPLRLYLPTGCQPDPIFLLPKGGIREKFLQDVLSALSPEQRQGVNEAYVSRDGLDPLVERVMRSLLRAEKAELRQVFEKYVRVERFSFSAGEGVGIATIEPQPHRAASAALVWGAANTLHKDLPEALQAAAHDLVSVQDPVAAAHRGLVLFDNVGHELGGEGHKGKPTSIDPYREAIEGGVLRVTARVESGPQLSRVLPFDAMVMGCMNDTHLDGMLQSTERSGRLLSIARGINAPLLLNCFDERDLLEHKLSARIPDSARVSPHVTLLLSLFAVSTRVLSPDESFYREHPSAPPKMLGKIAERLNGVAKAVFLSLPSAEWPDDAVNWALPSRGRFRPAEISQLFAHQHLVNEEFGRGIGVSRASLYDGGIGIDGRDLETLLLDVVSTCGVSGLGLSSLMQFLERKAHTPFSFQSRLGVQCFEELERLREGVELSEKRMGQLEERSMVMEPASLVEALSRVGRRLVRYDVTRALELPFSSQALAEFSKYLSHVRAMMLPGQFEIPKAHRTRPDDKKVEDTMPDLRFMESVRARIGVASREIEPHHRQLLGQLTSWAARNPDAKVSERLGEIFPDYIEQLAAHFRRENISREREFVEDSMRYADSPELVAHDLAHLPDKTRVERWKRGWERLCSGSEGAPKYPEQLLLKDVLWAYQHILRGPKTGSGRNAAASQSDGDAGDED